MRYRATVRIHADPNIVRHDIETDDVSEASAAACRWLYQPGVYREVEVIDRETGCSIDWTKTLPRKA